MSARIAGVGCALPDAVHTSAELEAALDLPPDWIVQRTGVRERRIAGPDVATSDLAIAAGRAALRDAGVVPTSVGMLILATSTPDHPLPASAPLVAHQLGMRGAAAFDLAAACTGFLYALNVADAVVRADAMTVLVLAANVLSRRVAPGDCVTRPLFADGAGAALLVPGDSGCGVLASVVDSDGSRWRHLRIDAGGSRQPLSPAAVADGAHLMKIEDGPAVFRFAVDAMVNAGRRALVRAGLALDAVDWWIPHQANKRIVREAGRRLGIAHERTVSTVERYGNSSSATIPIALSELRGSGRLEPGHILLMTGAGAGLTSGASVVRW